MRSRRLGMLSKPRVILVPLLITQVAFEPLPKLILDGLLRIHNDMRCYSVRLFKVICLQMNWDQLLGEVSSFCRESLAMHITPEKLSGSQRPFDCRSVSSHSMKR